jgi:hypothetical protein
MDLPKLIAATIILSVASSQAVADTIIVNYVEKTQEERKSTRWTLTEWLRIKERMKAMDVWLAMFSNPSQDRFRPELGLEMNQGQSDVQDGGDVRAQQWSGGKASMYLTNMFSGTVGWRMLNVDVGLEGATRMERVGTTAATLTSFAKEGNAEYSNRYGLNLRVLGKSIQDSMIVAKYGAFRERVTETYLGDEENPAIEPGRYFGAELQLYLVGSLGINGEWLQYEGTGIASKSGSYGGTRMEYGAFIDVSILRVFASKYEDERKRKIDGQEELNAASNDTGWMGGIRLQI